MISGTHSCYTESEQEGEQDLAEHDKIIKHYHKKSDLGHPLLFVL